MTRGSAHDRDAAAVLHGAPVAVISDALDRMGRRNQVLDQRVVVIDGDLDRRLTAGFQVFVDAFNKIRQQSVAHAETCPARFRPEPIPLAEIRAFRDLLAHDVLGRRLDSSRDRKP